MALAETANATLWTRDRKILGASGHNVPVEVF